MNTQNIYGLFLGIVICPIATGVTLSLPAKSAGPNTTVVVAATLSAGMASISGLQFDLQYDNSVLSLIATPGAATRSSAKGMYIHDMAPNKKRFVIIGMNQTSTPDGDVIRLFVNVGASAGPGSYDLTLTNVTGTDGAGNAVEMDSSSGTIIVDGTSGVRIEASGVLNAASLLAGPVAPGEIITLIGSGIGPMTAQQPTSSNADTLLGGTSVLFDMTAAPLLYAAPNQINAIVPYGISGQNVTRVSILKEGKPIAGFSLDVSESAPAVFTLDGSGVGAGLLLNQDLTLNSPSNGAAPGSAAMFYANGAGIMAPSPMDGKVAGDDPSHPILHVAVAIGGIDAEVRYAGSAPGLIAGILQVNCVIPPNIQTGDAVNMQLRIGATSSPEGVVIAVR